MRYSKRHGGYVKFSKIAEATFSELSQKKRATQTEKNAARRDRKKMKKHKGG